MNLNEFSKLISRNDSVEARNTLSQLIGIGKSGKEWGSALINLYKSFPEEIRINKKDFLPVIVKYFFIYDITNENIDVFKEYQDLMSASEKDRLKQRQSHWVWDEEFKINFKNINEFIKAMKKNQNLKKVDFINKYKEELNLLVGSKKHKMINSFSEKEVWISLIKEGYDGFVDVCKLYDISRVEILRELFSKIRIGYLDLFNKNSVPEVFVDLEEIKKENILGYEFFVKKNMKHFADQYHSNVFGTLIEVIGYGNVSATIKYFLFFESDLKNYIKEIKFENNLKSIDDFTKAIEAYEDFNKSNGQAFKAVILNSCKKELPNFVDSLEKYYLNEKLNKELDVVNINKIRVKI